MYVTPHSKFCTFYSKARRTRAHLSRVLVIRDKLDRQNFLVCGQHLRHFRHSWHVKPVNQISNMFDIFRHSWQKDTSSIVIRHVVFNSASCTHAHIFLFRRACRLLAARENFLSRMTKNIKHVWQMLPEILSIQNTDRTRFGNATRIFSFQKQIKPSTDKNFTRMQTKIIKLLSGPEYLKNNEKY
jgi:hypothetical protein